MDLLKHTISWVQGDIMQARVMLIIGLLLLIAYVFIWKSSDAMLRGMIIPLSLVLLLLIGAGLAFPSARKKQLQKVELSIKENPDQAIKLEKERILKDKNAYLKFFIVWSIIITAGIVLFFLTQSPYSKGLALGILFFALSAFMVDGFLQQRSANYFKQIELLTLEK